MQKSTKKNSLDNSFNLDEKLFSKLTSCFGPSGREKTILSLIEAEVKSSADKIFYDNLGSLIVLKKGASSSKKIMFCAHADEIGIAVTQVDEKGFLRFSTVGGVDFAAKFGGARVKFENGVVGIICKEKMEAGAKIELANLYIDIGATSKSDALKKVSIGDFAIFQGDFLIQHNQIISKALDNRSSCYLLVEAIKNILTPKYDTYFVFSTQEEVGARGASTAAFKIMPDFALAVDVTLCGDTPQQMPLNVELNKGVAIKAKDRSIIVQKRVVDYLVAICKKNKIEYQMEVLPFGGTDGGTIQLVGEGITCGVLSIPCRYVHSPSEVVSIKDLEATYFAICAVCAAPLV